MKKPAGKILEDSTLALTRWAEYEEGISGEFFRKKNSSNSPPPINKSQVATISEDSVNTKTFKLKPYKDFVPISGVPNSDPYKLRFTPDFVLFGLGVNTYSGAAGQAVATFSDIMGDHRITLAGDLQIDFTEYAQVYAAYQYLKLRVNMMAAAFYYKNYSYDGSFRTIYHDLETGGALGLSYPFSMFSRADLQLTGSRIERVPVAYYSETYRSEPYETNLLRASLGFSYDNILWGITGPLNGVRAQTQFHAAPPLGFVDQSYISADVDVRHYTHILKRFVWANRLATGGSIALGDGKAARRFLLGGSENWFNYGVNAENYRENLDYNYSYHSKIVTPLRGWNYFDLDGDRMFMANSEFRFPFIREISTVWPLPMQIRYINGALFMDNGYAWTRGEQSGSFPLPPKLVSGFGFGMRANLGIFVLRYDRGWPTDWSNGVRGPINYFSLGAEF
jgi:outer membrane protein assembly factor BamA